MPSEDEREGQRFMTSGTMSATRLSTEAWATPRALFRALDGEFRFTVDVAANDQNHLCDRYYTREDSAFDHDWWGVAFMNPPYGREIGRWIKRAIYATRWADGPTVVALVPARTDTAWFGDIMATASELRLIRGGLHYGDGPGAAPFPSCVVVWRPGRRPGTPALSYISTEGARI